MYYQLNHAIIISETYIQFFFLFLFNFIYDKLSRACTFIKKTCVWILNMTDENLISQND